MINPNPKLCWFLALESGVRSQAGVSMTEAQSDPVIVKSARRRAYEDRWTDDEGRAQVLRYYRDQLNASDTRSRRGGAGAAINDEYAPFLGLIRLMEEQFPLLAAVGHVLCHPEDHGCADNIDVVVDETLLQFALMTPRFGDKRAWSDKKRAQLDGLIRTAWYERRINMSGEMEPWGCERISDFAAHWFGCDFPTRKWARDWKEHWDRIVSIVEQLEDAAIIPVEDLRREQKTQYVAAA